MLRFVRRSVQGAYPRDGDIDQKTLARICQNHLGSASITALAGYRELIAKGSAAAIASAIADVSDFCPRYGGAPASLASATAQRKARFDEPPGVFGVVDRKTGEGRERAKATSRIYRL